MLVHALKTRERGGSAIQLACVAGLVLERGCVKLRQMRLADQIQFWLGKAQAGAATAINDPMKVADRDNALKGAIATLRAAADKANAMTGADPEAKTRRAEMMLEICGSSTPASKRVRICRGAVTSVRGPGEASSAW